MTDTSQAIISGPGEGERLESEDRVYLVKVARPELCLIEYDTGPTYTGASPTSTSATRMRSSSSRASSSSRSAARRTSAAPGRRWSCRPGTSTPSRATAAGGPASSTSTLPTPASPTSCAPRTRGEDATFDSVDVDGPQDPGEGTVLGPGEGTTFVAGTATSVFKATREATAGSFSLAEVTIQPGTSGPPPHFHREMLDSFFVLEGTLSVRLGDDELEAPPGTYACAPPGIVHTFANRSDGPVRFLNLNTPGGWEDFIRDLAAVTPAEGHSELYARHDVVAVD